MEAFALAPVLIVLRGVELPRSGRRGAMSLGTILTGVFLFGFTQSKNSGQVLAFSCVTAATQQIMYGVLYAVSEHFSHATSSL